MGGEEGAGAEGNFWFPHGFADRDQCMLDFCARYGIESVVVMSPISQINEALDRQRQGMVHYRSVVITGWG